MLCCGLCCGVGLTVHGVCQLYVDGNLIGGLDIMKELHEEEELAAFGSA